MEPGYLTSRLALVDPALDVTLGVSHGILASLAVLALIFASVRTVVLGGNEPMSVIVRLLLCMGLLAIYREAFATLADASSELAMTMARHANWDTFWQSWNNNITELMAESESEGAISQFVSYLKGRLLGITTATATLFSFLVSQGIQVAAAVLLSILKVLGPLMIATGIFGGGQTIKQWFGAVMQVFCWPIVPPVIMVMLSSAGQGDVTNDNAAYAIAQTALLGFLTLSTPLLVGFVMGRCGVTALAGVVTAAGAGLAMNAAGHVASAVGPMAKAATSMAQKGMGAMDKAAGMAVADRMAPYVPSPGDMQTMTAGTRTSPPQPNVDPHAITGPHMVAPEDAPTGRGRARWIHPDTAADPPRVGDTLPNARTANASVRTSTNSTGVRAQ